MAVFGIVLDLVLLALLDTVDLFFLWHRVHNYNRDCICLLSTQQLDKTYKMYVASSISRGLLATSGPYLNLVLMRPPSLSLVSKTTYVMDTVQCTLESSTLSSRP